MKRTSVRQVVIFIGLLSQRLEAANLKVSAGTTSDSYDNAWAATVNGLYKTEVIEYLKSDWAATADVEPAIH